MTRILSIFLALTLALAGCRSGAPVPTGAGGNGAASQKYGAAPINVPDLYIPGAARGSVVFTDATGKEKVLAPGTAGFALTSGGPGADPTYAASGGTVAPGTAGQAYVTNAGPVTAWATPAGDWSGPLQTNVVAKVNGTSFPAGGALTTGNACYVSGISDYRIVWNRL